MMKNFVSVKLKKQMAVTLGIAMAITISVFSMTSGKSDGQPFRLKKAQAALTVACDCAFWGGNSNCLANNYGASCAADGTAQCEGFNSNCGGKNAT